MTQFTLFILNIILTNMVKSGHISTFCAKFNYKDTSIKQPNTWALISNSSVEVSSVCKRANEIIKPLLMWKTFSWTHWRHFMTFGHILWQHFQNSIIYDIWWFYGRSEIYRTKASFSSHSLQCTMETASQTHLQQAWHLVFAYAQSI